MPSERECLLHWEISNGKCCPTPNVCLPALLFYFFNNFPQICTYLLCRIMTKILSFTKLSKILFDLTLAICKAQEFSFPYKNCGIFQKRTKKSYCFSALLLPCSLPLKDRILGVSCNLYENVMLSSSFIYVMQSQYSPLQNLKHTQWNLTGKGGKVEEGLRGLRKRI